MGQDIIIHISVIVSACISLVSCTLLLLAIVLIKDFRSLPYKLISYLCITDMLTSIAFLLPNKSNLCSIQGFLINFSILSSFLFTSVILHFLKWSIVDEKQQSIKLHCGYLAVGWLVPFLLSLIPIFTNSYYRGSFWCWIKNDEKVENLILQVFEGYGVALMVLVYNIYNLVLINRKLKKEINSNNDDENIRRKLMKRMIYYPLVIIICIFPAICLRITTLISQQDEYKYKWLEALSADFQCFIGFANCLVYGLTDNLKKKVKSKLQNLIDFDPMKMNQSV